MLCLHEKLANWLSVSKLVVDFAGRKSSIVKTMMLIR